MKRPSAIRINCFWFASLVISLSTAFLTILAKQWVLNLGDNLASSPRLRGRQRQYRQDNIDRWKLPVWLSILPIFLHISLLLFFAGLIEFTFNVERSVYIVTTIFVSFTGAAYVITHVLSFAIVSCPYKTSVTLVVLPFLDVVLKEIVADFVTLFWAIPLAFRTIQDVRNQDQLLGSERNKKALAAGSVFTYSMRFRTFFKHWWSRQALPWFAWRRRELQAIRDSVKELDGRALAWIIDQSLWVEKTSDLAAELCRMYHTLRHRRLFIDAGAVALLAHELKVTYNGQFRDLSKDDQSAVLECSALLAKLATEADEGDTDTAVSFMPDGIPFNIDIDDTAKTHLISSGICRSMRILKDTANFVLLASMLRLHIFCVDDESYAPELVRSVKSFLDEVKKAPEDIVKQFDDQDLMVVVNTIIYIGMRQDLLKLLQAPAESKLIDAGKDDPEKDGEKSHPTQRQNPALEALLAVMLCRPDMGIAIRRQICWGLWALSTEDDPFIGNSESLIPIFTETKTLYRLLSELLTERMDNLLVFEASLQVLESLAYLPGPLSKDAYQERIQFFQVFVDKFPTMVRSFCDEVTGSRLDQISVKHIFMLMINLWYYTSFSPFVNADNTPSDLSDIDADPLFELLDYIHDNIDDIPPTDKTFLRMAAYQAACRTTSLYLQLESLSYDQRNADDVTTGPVSGKLDPILESNVMASSVETWQPLNASISMSPVSGIRQEDRPVHNSSTNAAREQHMLLGPTRPPLGHGLQTLFDSFPTLVEREGADLELRIAREFGTTLSLLDKIQKSAADKRQWRARTPHDSVTRGFMQMLTNALRDTERPQEDKGKSFRDTLLESCPSMGAQLHALSQARIQGVRNAVEAFNQPSDDEQSTNALQFAYRRAKRMISSMPRYVLFCRHSLTYHHSLCLQGFHQRRSPIH